MGIQHDASLKLLQKIPEEMHITQFTETQEETILANKSPSPRAEQKQKHPPLTISQTCKRTLKSPTRRPRYVPDMSITINPRLAKSKYLDATANQLKMQDEQLKRITTNREETQRKLE